MVRETLSGPDWWLYFQAFLGHFRSHFLSCPNEGWGKRIHETRRIIQYDFINNTRKFEVRPHSYIHFFLQVHGCQKKVFLDRASLLRLVLTPFLHALKPNHANIVNISKVLLDAASLLRLVLTPFLRAFTSLNANTVNIS